MILSKTNDKHYQLAIPFACFYFLEKKRKDDDDDDSSSSVDDVKWLWPMIEELEGGQNGIEWMTQQHKNAHVYVRKTLKKRNISMDASTSNDASTNDAKKRTSVRRWMMTGCITDDPNIFIAAPSSSTTYS